MIETNPSQGGNVVRTYRVRVALFLAGVIGCLVLLSTLYRGINTIDHLDRIERERDQWQRPAEVLQALNIRDGSNVVDLGSGAGYFTLKVSRVAGGRGRVWAVDLRRLPLLFLWIRSLRRSPRNVTVIHGRAEDPSLPAGGVDAVLLANTYHELSNPKMVLDQAFRSLASGGRLVVLDRGPPAPNVEHDDNAGLHHALPVTTVAGEILQSGFEIISRQDRFIDQSGKEPWWLIVARKP